MNGEALLPQLDEAQKALVDALEEACSADLFTLDTPELVRLEETLGVASKAAKEALPDAFRSGWLVFDSADEVRRVAPIPEGWMELPVDELRLLCQRTAGTAKRISATPTPQRQESGVRP